MLHSSRCSGYLTTFVIQKNRLIAGDDSAPDGMAGRHPRCGGCVGLFSSTLQVRTRIQEEWGRLLKAGGLVDLLNASPGKHDHLRG
jgi:hypothetical protein